MKRIRVGFFSFVEVTDPAEHKAYNEWHQLDHMPEQFQIPGIAYGQRFVASPRCRDARVRAEPEVAPAHYVALYLMGDPAPPTLDEFAELGDRLRNLGRFHQHRHSHLSGAWQALEGWAAPRVLVGADVVPWRPGTGIYTIVEEPVGDVDAVDAFVRSEHLTGVPRLLEVPGVAGVWTFSTSALYRNPRWTPGRTRITVCWLDGDPVTTATALAPLVEHRWSVAPMRPILAGPWEVIRPYQWDWFD